MRQIVSLSINLNFEDWPSITTRYFISFLRFSLLCNSSIVDLMDSPASSICFRKSSALLLLVRSSDNSEVKSKPLGWYSISRRKIFLEYLWLYANLVESILLAASYMSIISMKWSARTWSSSSFTLKRLYDTTNNTSIMANNVVIIST